MTRLLVISVAILSIAGLSAAQDDAGWPVEQRCVGEPTTPPEGWTFDGTIFVEQDDGVHAINADVATPYFVAFNGSDLTSAGAISPDGKWYAVPSGYTEYVSMLDDGFIVEEIRVYSTNPAHEIFRVPWRVSYRGMRDYGFYFVSPIRWLDHEHLIYELGGRLGRPYAASVINPFTGEITIWGGRIQDLHRNLIISPDWTRAVGYHDVAQGVFDTTDGELLTDLSGFSYLTKVSWISDSSQFAAAFPSSTDNATLNLGLFDRDGNLVEMIFHVSADFVSLLDFAWGPDGHKFALTVRQNNEFNLYVGDIDDHVIVDTCLASSSVAWSPNGQALAFSFFTGGENIIGVYDQESEIPYIAAYHTGRVIAWREGW